MRRNFVEAQKRFNDETLKKLLLSGRTGTIISGVSGSGAVIYNFPNNFLALIAQLISIVDGDSGADYIGATPIPGVGLGTEDSVQELLEALATMVSSGGRQEQDFTNTDPWVVNHGAGKIPAVTVWEMTIEAAAWGSAPYGTSYYGGTLAIYQVADPEVAITNHVGVDQMIITWGSNKSGKVVYVI